MTKIINISIIEWICYILVAIFGFYAMIDGLSSAIDFFTAKKSIIASIIILTIWLAIPIYLKKNQKFKIRDKDKPEAVKKVAVSMRFHLFCFAMILALWIPHIFKSNEKESVSQIVCDRDKYLGCKFSLDSGAKFGSDRLDVVWLALKVGEKIERYTILTDNPKNKDRETKRMKREVYFPYSEYNSEQPPFSISYSYLNQEFHFKGKIFDYKTDELLGWFNGNEFGVVKPCAFSWNKDDYSLEIIDKYGQVVFSMEKSYGGGIRYRGFYKIENTFHIFNDKEYVTTDIREAKKHIANIKPMLEHFGTNSLGKRIRPLVKDFF